MAHQCCLIDLELLLFRLLHHCLGSWHDDFEICVQILDPLIDDREFLIARNLVLADDELVGDEWLILSSPP